jgi:hypothetical protein
MTTNNMVISSNNSINSLYDCPPILEIDKIREMTNRHQLKVLEHQYDQFIEKYARILILYNIADKYLCIRDELIIRIAQLDRIRRLKIYTSNLE